MSVTEFPWQKVVGPLGVIDAFGKGLTVTDTAVLDAVQPLAAVTVTT